MACACAARAWRDRERRRVRLHFSSLRSYPAPPPQRSPLPHLPSRRRVQGERRSDGGEDAAPPSKRGDSTLLQVGRLLTLLSALPLLRPCHSSPSVSWSPTPRCHPIPVCRPEQSPPCFAAQPNPHSPHFPLEPAFPFTLLHLSCKARCPLAFSVRPPHVFRLSLRTLWPNGLILPPLLPPRALRWSSGSCPPLSLDQALTLSRPAFQS